jgi:uncharacterized protein (TIGR03437 family)
MVPLTGALREAVNAARYNFQEQNQNGEKVVEAVNPAQNLCASFTNENVQINAHSACQTPWQLGLKLKHVDYGTQRYEVRPGKVTAQGNRVEIHHSLQASNLASQITAWYLNKPEGLEQGFTLQARPTTAPSGELRVVMELSRGWTVTTDRDQQAITLQQGAATLRYDKLHTIDATGRKLPSRMEVSDDELALVVNDADAVWPITIDPTLTQQTQFIAADGIAYDHFGAAVAISGDTAVVGVPDFDASGATNAGTVFVFVRADSVWSQQAQLTASDAANNDNFGAAVAISGDTIIVGAYGDDNGFNSDQGAAYVFTRSGTTWSQQAKLSASQGAANDWFGYAVAVSGETAIIGAPLDDFSGTVNQGTAYVFTRSGTTWSQQQQLNAAAAADSDNFGFAVALQNETTVVGAPADDVNGNSDQGSAYVFVRNATTWTQQQQLNGEDGASGDLFGYAVAISGETTLVGAPQDDINGNVNQGSAHVFTRSNATWSQPTRLTANDGASGDTFGQAVALSGEMTVIGAPRKDVGGNSDQGSAYVFVRDNATWTQQQQTLASGGASNDSAGQAVAISGFTALIGAPNDDVNGNNDQGSTYVFSPTCPTMTLSPATLPNGTQNLTYPTTTISSGAGTAPLTYAIIAGTLPAGLTFSASGALSGTPTEAGNFNFTVKVTDANLCTGRQSYALAIATCAPPAVSTHPANQSSAVGSSASFTAAASGTPPTVQWQVSSDGNSWSNIEGATNTTLNLTNVAITLHGNRYRAVFTNACGTATSDPATLTVNQLTPAVTLNSSATSVTYGQSVTLTANVSSVNAVAPTGTITFKDGAATLGTATINNGQASLSLNSLNAAIHSLTAEYSGDQNYLSGATNASALTVNKAVLTVTAANKTKTYGAVNPELTATITGFVNEETASVVTGNADLNTTATASSGVGEYPITAARGTLAAANYDFTFVAAKLTIGQAALTITAEAKSRTYGAANPALTATITGFVNDETESVLSGALQLVTTATVSSAVGDYPISVSGYTSTNYAINYVAGTLTISKAVLTVTAENKTKTYGAANPELTATITGFVNNENTSAISGTPALTTTATPTSGAGSYPINVARGTLSATNYEFTFVNGTLTIGKARLTVTAANKIKVFGAPVPELTYNITGFLNGDEASVVSGRPSLTTTATDTSNVGSYPISVAPGTLTAESYEFNFVAAELTISPAATAVVLSADLPMSLFGQAVTFTANVAAVAPGAGTPTGTIIFKDGTTVLGSSALGNGQAAFTTSALATGAHNITAEYSGADNFTASASQAVTHTVAKAAATVTLASSFETVRYGQSVTLNATVSGNDVTGNVRFLNGNVTLGTVALTNGAASLTTNTLTIGSHTITAVYDGDAKNDGGTSRHLTLTVNKALPVLQISSSANPVAWKQFVTLAASVNSAASGLVAPSGTIVFKEGATVLGNSALSRLGRASISINTLAPGSHSITAEFSGDSSYEAATTTAISQTVGKGETAVRLTASPAATTVGQVVTFSAQVHGYAGTPTGEVEIYDGTQLLDTVSLSNGLAAWATTSLGEGEHAIKAVYKGDEQFAGSTSAAVAHTVSLACVWTPATTNYWIGPNGGAGFIPVAGLSDCFWFAFTTSPWITIQDYGPEVGAVSFAIAPLPTETARRGTMIVAEQRITILQAKPAVTVSGASYTREGLAPEAIASVFGEGLATATEQAQALPLPTTLAGTQVKITDSKGVEHNAPLFYVSPLQINYLIPSEVALGTALVTIQTETSGIIGGGLLEVTPITPALFTANANGSGVAAAVVQRVLVDGSQRYEQIAQFDPAQNKVVSLPIDFGEEGEEVYLVLFGTGLRSRLDLATVRATIADEDIEILYAGAQGSYVGLDQINLKVPRTLTGKGEVDLKLWVEGKLANTVRINLK